MANRRMLARNISLSKKLARCRDHFSRLCWTWTLPHTDEFGRFEADPEVFKATVFPLLKDVKETEVADSLNDLCEIGLISLYFKQENVYGEITNFDEFQTFKNDRKRTEEYPAPEQQEYIYGIQWNPKGSNWIPLASKRNPKRREGKLRKGKGGEAGIHSANPELKKLQETYPVYLSVGDDDLNALRDEFKSIDLNMVLRDLFAWERGNKKPTVKALSRLRNFCKIAAQPAGHTKGNSSGRGDTAGRGGADLTETQKLENKLRSEIAYLKTLEKMAETNESYVPRVSEQQKVVDATRERLRTIG